jgi:hypothetical protein
VQCPPRVTQIHSNAVDATQNAVNGVSQWTSAHAAQLKHTALVTSAKVTEQARKTSREASEKVKELVRETISS